MIAEAAAAGAGAAVSSGGNLLEAEEVVDSVIAGLADERFLILPHPETARYAEAKARDIDRWIAGMRRLLPPDVSGPRRADARRPFAPLRPPAKGDRKSVV